jgi:hypothetical protein
MEPEVTAAVIIGAVTVLGFVVQGALISRWLDKKRLADVEQTEVLKGKIALENTRLTEALKVELTISAQEKMKEMEDRLANRRRTQDSRRESLELLFNASSIAKSAAGDLLKVSTTESSEERIRNTADSLQRMAQFFEKSSDAERNLHLIEEDVLQVKVLQGDLARIFLLLDLDSVSPSYQQGLQVAYGEFNQRFEGFRSYVRSATAEA